MLNTPWCWLPPPFYNVILGFEILLILPPWLPGYQSPCYASHSDGWFFPCFSLFSSFHVVSLIVTCWLSISGRPWVADLQSLFFQGFLPFRLSFWPSFLFVIFLKWAESTPAKSKVFPTTSSYGSFSYVLRGPSFLFTSCRSLSLLVPCCITRCLKRTYPPFVSRVSWHPFRVVSIPLQLCCTSRGSQTFGILWGSRPSPFH